MNYIIREFEMLGKWIWITQWFKFVIIGMFNILFLLVLYKFNANCISLIVLIYTVILFIRSLFQSINPLYAFWNIWEKIQKLTPEIEKESKLIQSEFEKNQNFSILHAGFEKLSTTFSRIVELILKLERLEKKANKGNLFDSVKYINSLRMDIMLPPVELKSFLEKQREQLIESQQELTRVRVGWDAGLEENSELSSKRGEELLGELDENIRKLEEMIGKMW